MYKFIVESPYERKLYRIRGEPIVIGRSRAADIPLLDERARKRHVEILRGAGGLRFRDLSGGETRHNGRPAVEGALVAGDRLEIGSTRVTLEAVLRDEPEVAAVAPAPEPAPPAAPPTPSVGLRSVRVDPAADERLLAGGFRSVLEINKRLLAERDPERLWPLLLDAAIDLAGAERGFLLVRRGESFAVRAARNMEGDPLVAPEAEVSRGIALSAMDTRRAVLSADAGADDRWAGMRSVAALKLRSVLSVPLVAGERVLGALYLDNRIARGAFSERDVSVIEALADQATLAILMHRRAGELTRRTREVAELNARLSAELAKTREDLRLRQKELEFRYDYRQIVGRSPEIRRILGVLDKVTDLNVPVLIEGESGTGKELAARALHFNGPRREGPFVSENVSAIPETLIEKVLFGHERGAFTGATESAPGLFELADGGTLFLDEVGDMSPDMQKKILRVLQEGEVRRVGAKEVRKVDVRIVSATNRDIEALLREGRFRDDLFFRLVVVRVRMPPLRARGEDIPLLVEHFLREMSAEMGVPVKPLESGALDLLVRYPWPGNVRELGNEMRRALALSEDRITAETLSAKLRAAPALPEVPRAAGRSLHDLVEDLERAVITAEMERRGGNRTRVAEALGLSRLGLRNKLTRYGLGGPPEEDEEAAEGTTPPAGPSP
ncbi:MAG: sigma 54-interacting transcriptional regulator [Planctomycetes bacterium]|jgi:transcriptional regulator with GAF, ATPase, and Fis domain|nr:sigma 54-interacting transcriptional regulator [Planctomycetota bacterium]